MLCFQHTSKSECRSRPVVAELHQFLMTTCRQPRVQHHLWKWSGFFCSLAMSMPGGWCYNSWISREHTLAAKCSATTCTSMLRRSLAWTRHTACDSRDAGTGHVTRDTKPSSWQCETISKGTTSHKERTPRASTETRDDGCGTVCTVTTTCVWEHGWTMRGTDRKFIKRFIMTLRGNLGLAAHHSREMRILNRVLTWRSSEAGRAERSHTRKTCDTRTSCCVTMAWSPGRAGGKTVPWDTPAFLAKNPRSGAYLPGDQARSFKSRCLRNLFIPLDRPDDQRRRNTEAARQVLPHISAEMITDLTWCRFLFSN